MIRVIWLLSLTGVLFFVSSTALATTERFAIVIGNNRGEAGEVELRYAESDGQRVYDTLKNVGQFPPANLVLLRGEDAATVQRTLITINDRIRSSVSQPNTQAMLMVYYSGHADAEALHLGRSRLELKELERLVRGSAATFRMLLLDSCRSGAITRVKGGKLALPFAVKVDQPFDGEGAVFLTATSASEDAQESDELKGSYFTHFFISALLGAGDENQDRRISLDEAYRYSYENTLRATSRTWRGIQHPTFRYEFRGRSNVVLAELEGTSANQADLSFPPKRTYLVMQGSEHGNIVGEVSAAAAGRRLRVKPGRYFVRGRTNDYLLEGPLAVKGGEVTYVSDSRLRKVAYARMLRKGGADFRSVSGPQAGYLFRTALRNGSGLCHGAFAGYIWNFEHFSFSSRLHGCLDGFDNDVLSASSDEAGVDARFSHAWDFPGLTIDVGVTLGASLLFQSFETPGVAPDRTTFAGHVDVGAAFTFEIYRNFYAFTDLSLQSYLYRYQATSMDSPSWTPAMTFRDLIGVGLHL